ncbi:MAG: D-glycero-beta-D-manno-heptose 1-phosphate adenylyltransferase [Melioribacteraceae bacterium]|nr:D-glycero-beta-D-manno-heptose 1-phosphate adenylyltransferase [Melioribacteraceae bacterium]MCO6474030.1 D-glycero-beta-D-manno-heptose 1-phosphate adenylyltransferase [Melioribacteraceae bacterium]MDD3557116.1 D-glycero-beta-D-manno-heptose 1-phosphate adenylyltransferase [Melioribacteraceae bacterium]
MTHNNILPLEELKKIRENLKSENKKVVFTNGCFDILHAGHVDYLNKAKLQGDVLIVALNSDKSVRKIKGEKRPIIPEDQRGFIISNLKCVDYVTFFDDDTPGETIQTLIPDILVKGSDWEIENIIGREIVEENGGSVITIDFVTNTSSSEIIETILERYR